jgi:hypothetical protein
MNVRVAHGSKVNSLSELKASYYDGNNGANDGIGIYLTAEVGTAINYATDEGSVYLVDLNTEGFLTIAPDTYLSPEQSAKLEEELNTLPEEVQYRLATDICGKKEHVFLNEEDAEEFYKKERVKFKEMDLRLDRLKPEIDFNEQDQMMILAAHKSFSDIGKVETSRIHKCLNLLDNSIATSLLKTISSGLILEREEQKENYLSFRFREKIVATLDNEFLSKENAKALIEESCKKYSTRSASPSEHEQSYTHAY